MFSFVYDLKSSAFVSNVKFMCGEIKISFCLLKRRQDTRQGSLFKTFLRTFKDQKIRSKVRRLYFYSKSNKIFGNETNLRQAASCKKNCSEILL